MKRLLLLAGILAGTVAPYLPAQADPHDRPCAGVTDSNCTRPSDGMECDTWVEIPDVGSLCYHPLAGPQYIGGCTFATNNDPTGQILNEDTQTGVISGTVIGFDADPAGNPARTRVECWVTVNGGDVCYTDSGTQPVLATTSDQCQYVAHDGDIVQLCQTITVNSQVLSGPKECFDSDSVEFPPSEFWTLVCTVLADLGPLGDPPNNGIAGDGDIWVNGTRELDCDPLNN